jgi:NADH-quinone oxidoreductase subunit N
MTSMTDMNWMVIYPEALLLLLACVVAIADLFVSDTRRRPTFWMTQASFAAVAAMHLAFYDGGLALYGMQGMVVTDPMGHLLAFFATIAMMATVAYAQPYIAERDMLKGEFFVLSMFVLLGISVMIAANNFLVVYLGLELMSLSLYALVALRRDHGVSTEAAMKYFVLGALASGFLLYGLSMMYGATGSLEIPKVFEIIGKGVANKEVLVFGIVFVVAGLAFKLAAFAITIRLLVEGMLGLAVDWQQMLIVLALASLIIGNLAAIAQSNLKRMLAYSSIAQMGFMLLAMTAGVVSGNTLSAGNAYSSAMFYIVTYVLTTLGTFGLIMYLARQGFESEEINDLAGLNKRAPWLAGVMGLMMFSLAGIPPAVGFSAKFAVLQALVTTNVALYVWLAIIAVMLSLIGAFYYLRVVKTMYFDEPADTSVPARSGGFSALLALNGAAVLLFGVLPDGLMAMCRDAILKALAT